jgi:hypothetical protein
MYMRLSAQYNEHELIDELRSFDPRMMMFLRRLKRIKINIHLDNGDVWSRRLGRKDGFLRRQNTDERVTQLEHDGNTMRYIVTDHDVSELPTEEKRPGVSKSKIILAFPTNDGEPEPQQVYAFLPIRDFGFRVSCRFSIACCVILIQVVPPPRRLFTHCESRRHRRLV